MITKHISLSLHSVNTATVVGHLQGLSQKQIDQPVVEEPLKSRLITVQANVCCSEMTVSQKNINFGRSTVGEQYSWSVSVSNLSGIPVLYSISKSGSISSGFLFFSSGRQGQIPPHSTSQVEIIFKPTLPGPFEEELKIHNILNPQNCQSIVIKAKVLKPESFSLCVEPDRVESSQTSRAVPNHDSEVVHLGETVIGEYSRTFSIFVRNITQKTRQFIVDASHNDAVSVDAEAAVALGLDADEVCTICSMTCNFEENSSDRLQRRNRISEEEREQLEDKLERYNQKLKIGIRKQREDKISKYRKKIQNTRAYLEGDAETLEGDRDSDEERDALSNGIKASAQADKLDENSASGSNGSKVTSTAGETAADLLRNIQAAVLPPSDLGPALEVDVNGALAQEVMPPRYIEEPLVNPVSPPQGRGSATLVGTSTSAFHFQVPAESETEVRVKITFLPGISYFPWSGNLKFQGYLRVFESRNEDIVKTIHFDALLGSNKASLTDDGEVPQTKQQSLKQRKSSDPPLYSASAFIATVAQWSSYPTKQLYPRYRTMPQNMLGMAVKLIPCGQSRLLQGSFSISSTSEYAGHLRIICSSDSPALGKRSEYESYDPAEHGPLDFALAPNFDYEYPEKSDFSPDLELSMEPSTTRKFLVQWQPSPHHKKLMLVGSIRIEFRSSSDDSSLLLLIPFVGVLEHTSIISVEKYINLGYHAVGSKKKSSFTIKNRSDSEQLHYVTMVVSVAQSKNAVGKIAMTSSRTGVIPPLSSKTVDFTFTSVALGKFEQQVWVGNLNDRFDQKRLTIRANVIVPEFQLVLFPQLELNEEGMPMPLNFGLIQVSSNPRIQSPDFVYRLRMINISSKVLLVTAIPNLKKQCFVYCDKEHRTSTILHEMPPTSTSYLYFVIRPTSVLSSSDESRELVGGIRLLFASFDPDAPILKSKLSTNSIPSDEDVDEYNKTHKLFERSLVFNAYIGSSVLSMVDQDLVRDFFTLDSSFLCSKGVLRLENKSQRFPLKYLFVKGTCLPLGSDGIAGFASNLDEKFSFVINDFGEGELVPGQVKEFEYYFVAETGSGLLLQKVSVLNLSTGVESSLDLSASFPGTDVHFNSNDLEHSNVVWVTETSDAFRVADGERDATVMEGVIVNDADCERAVIPFSDLPLEIILDSGSTAAVDVICQRMITGLSKCGSLITLPPKCRITCRILSKGELKKSTIGTGKSALLSSGMRAAISGQIVWLSSDGITTGNQEFYDKLDLIALPVCGSVGVSFDFQNAILKLPLKTISLGKVKSNRPVTFCIGIESCTDAMLPLRVSNLHPWMTVLLDNAKSSDAENASRFDLQPKEYCSVQLLLDIPRCSKNLSLRHPLVLESLVGSFSAGTSSWLMLFST